MQHPSLLGVVVLCGAMASVAPVLAQNGAQSPDRAIQRQGDSAANSGSDEDGGRWGRRRAEQLRAWCREHGDYDRHCLHYR